MAPTTSFKSTVVDLARRVSALVCLAGAYQFAATQFSPIWLAVTAVAALVVATGPRFWAPAGDDVALLPWPQWTELPRYLVPGWVLMLLAGVLRVAKFSPHVVLQAWLAGVACLLVGAWLLSRKHQTPTPAHVAAQRGAWVCGVLIVAAAAAVRLWAIDTVPRYIHCDEGTTVLTALDFFAKPQRDWLWFVPGCSPAFCYALAGWAAHWFGFNLTTARIPDVLLGILSIGLAFDGLRRVSNLRVAVVGASLLAANHCHLAYSRIASSYIQTAFVVSYVLALFARVWTAPTYFNVALLSVGVIVGAQTYVATTMTPVFLVASMVLLWILNPRRRRALLVPLGIFAISTATAGAPLAVAALQQRHEMMERSRAINIFVPVVMESLKRDVYHTDSTAEVVARQAWKALSAFHFGEDTNPQYGIWHGLTDRYSAALMIPGAVFALLALRQFLAVNALVFTVGYLLLALGMQKTFGYERTTGVLPFAMVVPAIALVQCWSTLFGDRGRWMRGLRDTGVAAGLLLCVAANFEIYFGEYSRWLYFGDETSEMAWIAREYSDRYTVHLIDQRPPPHEAIRLVLGSLTAEDNPRVLLTPRGVDPAERARTVEVHDNDLFVVWSQDHAARDALAARFPNATVQPWGRPREGPVLYLYFVGAARTSQG